MRFSRFGEVDSYPTLTPFAVLRELRMKDSYFISGYYLNKSTGVFFIFVKMGSALDMAAMPMLNARTYGYV